MWLHVERVTARAQRSKRTRNYTVGQEKNRIFSPTVSSRGCIAVAAAHRRTSRALTHYAAYLRSYVT